MKTVDLEVHGMSCAHCVRAVEDSLREVKGVEHALVELGRARVTCEDAVPRDALVTAIVAAGYEVG